MSSESEARLRALIDVLPGTVEGWEKAQGCEVYTPDNLHRYINGGAELYISYRFETMISQRYVLGDDEIRVDLFDMGSGAGAFGVFSHSRESVDDFVAPDIESEYAGGLLTFWKGHFYGSILAYPETDSKKTVVQALARRITAQIDEPSRRPAVVLLLPEEGKIADSVRFFWHHTWINDYHFFAHENLLNLGGPAEVAMAKYRPTSPGGKPAVLLAIQYPDADEASASAARFSAALLPGTTDGLGRQDDDLWIGYRRHDGLLVIVADAAKREIATDLMERCTRHQGQKPGGETR